MQYTLIQQLMKVFGGRSHATIHAHNKPKLTCTKMRSQRMSAHSFSESDEGLITILHNHSVYKINEVNSTIQSQITTAEHIVSLMKSVGIAKHQSVVHLNHHHVPARMLQSLDLLHPPKNVIINWQTI